MEIRLLNEHEIQWAVNTASETFETCVRACCRTQEEVNWFYGYVNLENIWREMSGGRLCLWGVFDEGQMCAVSAMQGNGHITILSVKQEYQFRRMGTQLLNAMYSYAAGVLHLERVTVLVSPVIKAAYFYRKGFLLLQPAGAQNPGVLLHRPLYQQPLYGPYGSGMYGGAAAPQGGWQSGPGTNPGGMQESAPGTDPGRMQESAPGTNPGGMQESGPGTNPGGMQESGPGTNQERIRQAMPGMEQAMPGMESGRMQEVMPDTEMGTAHPSFETYQDQRLRQEGQPQAFPFSNADETVLQDASFPSDMKKEETYPTRRVSTKLVLSVAAVSLGLCFLISVALAIVDIVTNV